jgi:hypothetical protein
LTRAAIAATTEILRNILTLDPGMQLSRNLGDKLLFIPRIKLGPSNNADPRKCHHGSGHTCMGKEAPARVGQRWVGLCSENCRSPLQKPGSACGKTRWLVEACAQAGGHVVLICNFMKAYIIPSKSLRSAIELPLLHPLESL